MTPFYGDKYKPRISGTIKNKNFYCIVDTGSAVTYMNINSFVMAFRKPLKINEKCKIDIFIKRRKCTHTIKITDEFSENILRIDFLQKHRLHFDQKTQQTSFLQTPSRAIFATRNFTLPPLATTLVQARSFQAINKEENYIVDIGVLKHPLISGPSTWVTFDENNHCTIQLQNCTPHEISIKMRDMLGIINTESTTPIPLDDDSIATICNQIHQRLPKVKKKTWTRHEIEKRCHLGATEA
jgi:hypothetical protein